MRKEPCKLVFLQPSALEGYFFPFFLMDRFIFLLSEASAAPELYFCRPSIHSPPALTERPGDRTSRSPTFACSRSHPAALIWIDLDRFPPGEKRRKSKQRRNHICWPGGQEEPVCVQHGVGWGGGGCSLCLSEQEKLLRKQELDHLQSCSRIWSLSFTDSCFFFFLTWCIYCLIWNWVEGNI